MLLELNAMFGGNLNKTREKMSHLNESQRQSIEKMIEKVEGKIITGKCSENDKNQVTDDNINNDGVSTSDNQ